LEDTRVDEIQHLALVLENSRYVPGPAIVCGRVFAGDPPGNPSSPRPSEQKRPARLIDFSLLHPFIGR
jgi:hypothetical protein